MYEYSACVGCVLCRQKGRSEARGNCGWGDVEAGAGGDWRRIFCGIAAAAHEAGASATRSCGRSATDQTPTRERLMSLLMLIVMTRPSHEC